MSDSTYSIIDRGFITLNGKEYLWTELDEEIELFDGEQLLRFAK